jgi:hypothetical protein
MAATDLWSYRDDTWIGNALVGMTVEAEDGEIGEVDSASDERGSYLVVDTGRWILGKKVVLPAGVIESVDLDAETVFVSRTKDEIENAPEFDESDGVDEDYRARLGAYYGERD